MENSGKIKVGIVGVTGYAGQEILRILLNHPNVIISRIFSHSYVGKKISSIYKNFLNICDLVCEDGEDLIEISKTVDVIFLSLPHGIASEKVVEEVIKNCKVIDLGADFRLKDPKEYEEWYKVEHKGIDMLPNAVYGLPELNFENIQQAFLIANPGCYATCSILSLFPLIKENLIDLNSIVIDAKSGTSGAGRVSTTESLFCEVNETFKAYKIACHRHTPEIESVLMEFAKCEDLKLTFVPHLIPQQRGIFIDAYAKLKNNISTADVLQVFNKYYKNKKFIRVYDENEFPETRWTRLSNFYDVGVKVDKRTNNVIVVGSIDNLIKGAAGQAIQNMNIMFEIPENCGLDKIGAGI